MDREPVFVVGIERSGTSLMYALLASHPSIAMTRRTNLWRYFYNQYGDLKQPDNLERCLAGIMAYKRLRVLSPDPERVRREFCRGEPTYARLLRLLVEHHLERTGKPRWGDKSLNTERYIDDVFAVYPNARVIHMIRDPRDRYASFRTGLLSGTWLLRLGNNPGNRNDPARIRRRYGRGGVGAATAKWLASSALAKRNQRRYPDRYKVLCYENLVTHPEETLREVCAFIGEECVPDMLSMEGAKAFRETGGNSSYGRREAGHISTASLGRFRQVMSTREIAFMQAYAGREMATYGYHLEPVQFSLGERVQLCLVDWPVNLAWMLAKGTSETLRDRRHRTPPAYTLVGAAEPVRGNPVA